MRLSVLFLEPPPADVPAFVSELDRLGYHRLWLTEHHNREQSASPVVMAAIAASHTRTMRIGTAGVLLELQHPIRAAQDFRVLESVFPGRIDLGVAGAVPAGPIGSALLAGNNDAGQYPRRVRDLVGWSGMKASSTA